jgi:dTMP kinase
MQTDDLVVRTGRLITFEGVEGAGKTTQIRLLKTAFSDSGFSVFTTREPGGEPAAESIRSILLAPESNISPVGELLLFLAARAQVTANVIRPRLLQDDIVICDRYIDSTVVYQGHARGHDLALVHRLNEFATGGLTPDLTILLDLEPEAGLARQSEHDRMEAESIAFHRIVRQGFLQEARKNASRFRVIDAARPVEIIHAEVLAAVKRMLPPPLP